MATYIKSGGTWKLLPDSIVKSSGTWKHSTSIHAKKSSAWQKVWDYYYWSMGSWGGCDASCATGPTGNQSRTVECKDVNGNTVDDSYCAAHTTKPPLTQTCSVSCTYQWNNGNWGACDAGCTATVSYGNYNRSVWCSVVGSGVTVGDSYCNSGTRPASTQACTIGCRSRAAWVNTYVTGYGYTSPVISMWALNTTPTVTITTGWTYNCVVNWSSNYYFYGYVKQGTTLQCGIQNTSGVWQIQSPFNAIMGSYLNTNTGPAGCNAGSGSAPAFSFFFKTTNIDWIP